jgi:hypothetical protein
MRGLYIIIPVLGILTIAYRYYSTFITKERPEPWPFQ